jgi:hypothetical protein
MMSTTSTRTQMKSNANSIHSSARPLGNNRKRETSCLEPLTLYTYLEEHLCSSGNQDSDESDGDEGTVAQAIELFEMRKRQKKLRRKGSHNGLQSLQSPIGPLVLVSRQNVSPTSNTSNSNTSLGRYSSVELLLEFLKKQRQERGTV